MPCRKLLCLPHGVDVGTTGRKVLQAGNVTYTTSGTGESLLTLVRGVSCIRNVADWVMGSGNQYTTTSVTRKVAVGKPKLLPSIGPEQHSINTEASVFKYFFFPHKATPKITLHFPRNPWLRKHLQAWRSWQRGEQLDGCQIIVTKICVEKCKTRVFESYNVFFWALPADVQEI